MTPPFLPLAAAAAMCVLAVPARAEDAGGALHRAQQAQLAAPVCRVTVNSKQVDTGKITVVLIETVRPNQMHMRQEQDGQVTMEVFTDGRKTMIRRGVDGQITEAPASVGAMVANLQTSGVFQAMADKAQDVKVAGHEVIDGQTATIYTFTTDTMGVHARSKLWISDKDALPLKGESDSTGGPLDGPPGSDDQGSHRHSEITFSYDPSITVAMPAAA